MPQKKNRVSLWLKEQGIYELALIFIAEIKDNIHSKVGHRLDFLLEICIVALVGMFCSSHLRSESSKSSRRAIQKQNEEEDEIKLTFFQKAILSVTSIVLLCSIFYENEYRHIALNLSKGTIAYLLISFYSKLFTLCEAVLFSNVLAEFLQLSFTVFTDSHSSIQGITPIADFFLICSIVIPILSWCIYRTRESPSPAFKFSILFGGILIQIVVLLNMVDFNPLRLITLTLSEESSYSCLAIMGVISVIGVIFGVFCQQRGLQKDLLRKVFHIQLVAVFVPGVMLAPRFTLMAVSGFIWIFFLLEFVRQEFASSVKAINQFDAFIVRFIDARDTKRLVLTHIYLLLGIAYPFIAHFDSSVKKDKSEFYEKAFAGVVVLGIGDSFAAIVGKSVGSIRIFGEKSLEGLLAFLASSIIFIKSFNYFVDDDSVIIMNDWFYVKLLIVAFVECLTHQIDNLLLPILFVSL